jgi:hypothetical protein
VRQPNPARPAPGRVQHTWRPATRSVDEAGNRAAVVPSARTRPAVAGVEHDVRVGLDVEGSCDLGFRQVLVTVRNEDTGEFDHEQFYILIN